MARDIAATPWVGVLQPGAADVVTFLDEFEVVDPVFTYCLDGEAEAGHASTDYEDFGVEGHGDIAGRVAVDSARGVGSLLRRN